jgi:cytochrome P450
MTVSKAADAYQLDLSAPALNNDPYQTYARLRANRGVHYWSDTPEHRFPVLSRYADVRLALRDPRFGPTRGSPVDHTQVCTPATHILSPVDVEPVRPKVQAVIGGLLDDLAANDDFDLIADFAIPLARRLRCGLSDAEPLAECHAVSVDDPITELAMTINLIGNGTLALLHHRDQLAWLRATPERANAAVEELLRFDSPLQRTARCALAEIELPEGDCIAAGELVTILIGAANRDYSQFAEPDRLDLDRPNAYRHLSFGTGSHVCVGAALMRLQAELALCELVRRLPNLRLSEPRPTWRPTLELRGLEALHVTF